MKVRSGQEEGIFKPFEMVLVVESEEEAAQLYALFVSAGVPKSRLPGVMTNTVASFIINGCGGKPEGWEKHVKALSAI